MKDDRVTEIILGEIQAIKTDIKEINKRLGKYETRITLISVFVALLSGKITSIITEFLK